jgi:cytochrome c
VAGTTFLQYQAQKDNQPVLIRHSLFALATKKKAFFLSVLIFTLLYACFDKKKEGDSNRKPTDYIRKIPGDNDSIPRKIITRGEVLIGYSDCYTCHKVEKRFIGPAFKDIAKRYPVNSVYIEMLAHKVIMGGSRSWGYAVMHPHPNLSFEDAKTMVTYILSLKE